MTPDCELLRRYAEAKSEEAFAELVQRHVNLVHSAALRQVNGDAHLAQDVAQTVFTDLARKAGSLARREVLTGWLYTSAHFAAAKIVRTENRRRDREEQFMREPIPETAPETNWNKLRPVLDDVMHELKEADREAILLRYFENQPFAEVGTKLGLNENAARMRVERALEKLRAFFLRRGIAATTALASVISANAVQIAPVGLAATLTSASLAAAGTGTITLLKLMTMTKLKLGISALVVAGAATALVVQHQTQIKLRAKNEALTQQLAQLKTDNESLSSRLATAGNSKSLPDEQLNELLRLRGEIGVLRRQTNELEKMQGENQASAADLYKRHKRVSDEMQQVAGMMRPLAYFNNGQYPTNVDQFYDEVKHQEIQLPEKFGKIQFGDFEFVGTKMVDENNITRVIVLRERVPYQTPDGKWERAYAFAAGNVAMQTSDDGNFDAFEK
jgi:RNA polymerase sigma factor (sigma-70 family)